MINIIANHPVHLLLALIEIMSWIVINLLKAVNQKLKTRDDIKHMAANSFQ